MELLEMVFQFEMANKYTIRNAAGLKTYWAAEINNYFIMYYCGTQRPFEIRILDAAGFEVIRLLRPYRCTFWCCPCCLQVLDVMAPPGNFLGRVKQEWTIVRPCYRIENAFGKTVLRIRGPIFPCNICARDIVFTILTPDGKRQVGAIRKMWSGLLREAFTDADFYGLNFPPKLDVGLKALLLGAVFLIDFMFFESTPRRNPYERKSSGPYGATAGATVPAITGGEEGRGV